MPSDPSSSAEETGSSRGLQTPSTVLLLFRARTRLCALPAQRLVETMRPLPAAPFPGAPAFVLGVARIRGAAVPVVDLGALLGCAEPPEPTRFLSLKLEGRRVALAVEAVLGLRQLAPEVLSQLPPLLARAGHEAVAAIGTLDAELLLSLEAARIVPDRLWALLDAGGSP
jgi:purine-binding chemotaxis protein CheW